VEVTQKNFDAILPVIRRAITDCEYMAIDCEMTGLYASEGQLSFYDNMEERYAELATSARTFIPAQLGLSCFVRNGSNGYEAQTFNIFLVPASFNDHQRRFSCEPKSMKFLAQCGFDFNKCFIEGVPFMPLKVRDEQLAKARAKKQPNRIAVRGPAAVEFVGQLVEQVRAWLNTSKKSALQLPPVNPYLHSLQLQELQKNQFGDSSTPGFYIEHMEVPGQPLPCLRLVKASVEEIAAWNQSEVQKQSDEVSAATGASLILEIVRDSGKPIVGHNPMWDLVYILESFAEQLPETYPEFKTMVQAWLPGGLYDTKLIALRNQQVFGFDTSLSALHGALHCREEVPQLPSGLQHKPTLEVTHAPGFTRYRDVVPSGRSFAHEAGFDAFMSGVVFAYELVLLQRAAGAARVQLPESLKGLQPYFGHLYVMHSDYQSMNLWGDDEVPRRGNILFVSGLAPGDDKAAVVQLCKAARLRGFNVDVNQHRLCATIQLKGSEGGYRDANAAAEALRRAVEFQGKQWNVATQAERLQPQAGPTPEPKPQAEPQPPAARLPPKRPVPKPTPPLPELRRPRPLS